MSGREASWQVVPIHRGGLRVVFCPHAMQSPLLLPRIASYFCPTGLLNRIDETRVESQVVRSAPGPLRTGVAARRAYRTKVRPGSLGLSPANLKLKRSFASGATWPTIMG